MLPINPNKNIQSFSASSSSNSSLPNIMAQIDSIHAEEDAKAESVVQISQSSVVSNQVYGQNNTVTTNLYLTDSDTTLITEKLWSRQSMALQPDTAPLADLGTKGLQKKYLESLQKDREIKDALAMYVAPECTSITDTKKRFSLEEKARDFLASKEKKVLLLLGVAGSGKSTFNRYLARSLWEAYNKEANKSGQTPIPLFIPLSSLKEPNANLISESLKKEGFTEGQIADLKANYRFIFILDGYDEIKDRTRLFYIENELDEWQAKVIVTSRPEYLGDRYERQFHPKGQAYLLQTYQLAPFSDLSIEEYVKKYKSIYPELEKSVSGYREILERSEVKELIRNPFLLKLSLSELPALAEKYKDSSQRITRLALYDQFVEGWFKRSQDRLSGICLTDKEQEAFDLLNKDFTKYGAEFSKDFAVALYQTELPHVTYLAQPSWKRNSTQDWCEKFLNNHNAETKLLRFNAPLICRDDQYEFVHKSLQDYLVARALWEELKISIKTSQISSPNELSIVKDLGLLWEELRGLDELSPSALFNELDVVKDPAVQSFLVEQVQQDRALLKPLLGWVKASKKKVGIERAAANALTVLVNTRVYFNRLDLSYIKVPGANLSYGLFDYTQFQGANLRGVNWTGAWLRGVNLTGADLAELKLGEKPTLEMSGSVNACCYSPDGHWLAVTEWKKIQLYEAETLQKIHTYAGHGNYTNTVVFSNDSQWLASGSDDSTVKLWGVLGERVLAHTYTGHGDKVQSIAFSVDSQWLASGSIDKTVKLWNTLGKRTLEFTYTGHEGKVNSIAFSANGQWLASGSADKTLKLWSTLGERDLAHTYTGHEGQVSSIAFSVNGQWLASGSEDKTVKLWSTLGERSLTYTYVGHSWFVESVAFSPNDQWLASGGFDRTVRLWNVSGDRSLGHIYIGHRGNVNSVGFSPDSQWLASGSWDHTVKFWHVSGNKSLGQTHTTYKDLATSAVFSVDGKWSASRNDNNKVSLWNFSGNRSLLYSYVEYKLDTHKVAFSSDNQWLAYGSSNDNTVKLWSVSGDRSLAHTYTGHEKPVNSVMFSSDGWWLASGSWDNTVKLWSVSGDRSLAHTYTGHEGPVYSAVFSSDVQWLASGGWDKTVKLWRVSGNRSLVRTYTGHEGWVESIAFSLDGQLLASGSSLEGNGKVRVWHVHSGDCLAILQDFSEPINSVAWISSLDGSAMLATEGQAQEFRLWKVPHNVSQSNPIMLRWTSRQDALVATGALIKNVRELSPQNKELLMQRGAVLTYSYSKCLIS
ncbi:MAG: WD40 repeat [Glomeribacter sp. 1016415]|nr:WD40 repeat [Glomeribacter sp. 1016415]